jgi:hypothetical protein
VNNIGPAGIQQNLKEKYCKRRTGCVNSAHRSRRNVFVLVARLPTDSDKANIDDEEENDEKRFYILYSRL